MRVVSRLAMSRYVNARRRSLVSPPSKPDVSDAIVWFSRLNAVPQLSRMLVAPSVSELGLSQSLYWLRSVTRCRSFTAQSSRANAVLRAERRRKSPAWAPSPRPYSRRRMSRNRVTESGLTAKFCTLAGVLTSSDWKGSLRSCRSAATK
jgi:hypothetical protein